MPKVKALREFGYAGRIVAAGDIVDVSDRDARTLIAVKRAQAVTSETDAAPDPAKERRYTRRDMRAKD